MMTTKLVARVPAIGSHWISKNGDHTGIEVVVVKIGGNSVVVEPTGKGISSKYRKKPHTWRLPLDAFYRRYEKA